MRSTTCDTGSPIVLYIEYSLGFGGAIKSLSLTLRGLEGVTKRVLTTQDPELVETWFAELPVRTFRRVLNYRTTGRLHQALERRVPLRPLRWAILKAVAVADWLVTLKNCVWIVSILRRERVDLIHLNNGFIPMEAFFAARLTGTPCVVHLRDFETNPRRVSPWVARTVARVIGCSSAVGESLRGTALRPDQFVVVHDPVDVDAVDAARGARGAVRARHGIAADEVAVGIFGRVIPWKGQREFVDAAIRALDAGARIRPVIVGNQSDGDRGYYDGIRRAIEESGHADRFVLAGYREEVEEYYAAMDVVVHASVTPEPFGMVVPEGMAAGCAVIAADAGGPREVVTDGVDGLLVPPGDVARLAAAILDLAGDPARCARLGARARRTVEERLRIEHNVAGVSAVYREVLHLDGPTPAGRASEPSLSAR